MAQTGKILSLDNKSDIVVSLKLIHLSLQQVNKDSDYWKWVIIALHSALQNAMILVLVAVNTALVYSPKSYKKWQEQNDQPKFNTGIQKYYMDYFLGLFLKLEKYSNSISPEDTSSWLDNSTKQYMEKLNSLRDEFLHFGYKSWKIKIMDLRNLTEWGLSFLELLLDKNMNVFFSEQEDLNRVSQIISDCKEIVTNL